MQGISWFHYRSHVLSDIRRILASIFLYFRPNSLSFHYSFEAIISNDFLNFSRRATWSLWFIVHGLWFLFVFQASEFRAFEIIHKSCDQFLESCHSTTPTVDQAPRTIHLEGSVVLQTLDNMATPCVVNAMGGRLEPPQLEVTDCGVKFLTY